MATDKQIEAIRKMASIADVAIDVSKIKDLDNGQLDVIFDDIRAKLKAKQPAKKQQIKVRTPDFSPVRFGLCCKMIIEKSNLDWVLTEKTDFIEKAMKLYAIITEAEAECSASIPFVAYYKKNPVTIADIQKSAQKIYNRDKADADYEFNYKEMLEEGLLDDSSWKL